MTFKLGCCDTGSGGQDRFAPNVLVGNVANGDSAVAYSSGGFEYIPDVGDGAGIAAAIAYVLGTLGGRGSIGLLPGTYDFNLPTSPVAPFTLPIGCSLRGSASENTFLVGLTGSSVPMFITEQGVELVGLTIVQQCGGPGGASGNLGVVTIQDDGGGTEEPCLFADLRMEISFEATSNVVGAFSVETSAAQPVRIRSVTSTSTGARSGADEDLWTRFIHMSPTGAAPVWIESCRADAYDVTLWVGTVANLMVQDLSGTFDSRFLHQSSLDQIAQIALSSCVGTARNTGGLALDVHSQNTYNVQVINSRFVSLFAGMTNECVRIRSVADGGHAIITGCTFRWDRAGAAVVVGTGAAGCDRNTITACHVYNPNVAGVAVEIVNAASTDNMVLGNSLEAVTQVTDGGTTSQIANNV